MSSTQNLPAKWNSFHFISKSKFRFSAFSFFCIISLCLLTGTSLHAQTPDANGIFYVKQGGTGGQTGNAWNNAIAEVGTALKVAQRYNASTPGTVKQIWVAGGTYTPMYIINGGALASPAPNDQNSTFLLCKDVKVYGGFAGTETSLADRDLSLTANTSILTGDIGVWNNNSDNAYHVVAAAGPMGTAVLDGFTITGGNANGGSGSVNVGGNEFYKFNGAGIYVMGGAPSFSNIIVSGNSAENYGVGICIVESGSDIPVTNAVISGNGVGSFGGGIGLGHSTITLTNVVISGNASTYGSSIYGYNGCIVNINNSVIYGNLNGIDGSSGPNGSYTISAQYSLIQGVAADATKHVLDPGLDPLFANAPSYTTAPFTTGNYRVNLNSPLIDAGSNSLFIGLNASSKDLRGKSRMIGNSIDIGAYEMQTQTITAENLLKNYGDADFEPGAINSSGLPLSYSSSDNSVALPYQDASDGNKWKISIKKAGSATITASHPGGGGYNAASTNFSVNIFKAQLIARANNFTKNYDGLAYSGGNGVAYTGFVYTDNASSLSGTLSFSNSSQGAINVGTYNILPGGYSSDNYNILYINGNLTINKAELTVTANDAAKTYDGIGYNGGNGVIYSGFVNNETSAVLSGTLAYTGNSQGATNVNDYVITPGGLSASNYNITYAGGTLSITKAALTVTANDASKVYDGLAYSGGNGVAISGLANNETSVVLGGTISYSGSSQGAINVNNYVITPAGYTSSNYDISFVAGNLNISAAPLTVTANNTSKVYNGLAYTGGNGVTYSGFVNNETATVVSGTVSYSGTSQGAVNADSYVITPGGLSSSNYAITYANGNLAITTAPLTITANNASKVYDGVAYSGGNGVTYSGFVNNETSVVLDGTLSYSGTSQGAVNVNDYVILPSGLSSSNYTITFAVGSLAITPASLTVTANNDSKTYNGVPYSGGNGVMYNGFVNNETSAVIGGTLSYSGTSQGATSVNNYVITPGGLSSSNYDISFADGSLVIGKAALTVTANDASKVYNGLPFSGGNGVSYTGFVNNETAATLGGSLSYTGTSQGAINVNNYVITPGGLSSGNYDISFANGTLAIGKAALTITANDASKVYNGIPYTGGNGVTYSGFVNNETAAALGGTLSYSGTSQGAINVNNYVITPGGLSSGNYDISFAAGNLAITKAALIVTADAKTKIYGEGDPTFTYIVNGYANGDNQSIFSGSLGRLAGEDAGDYAINQSTLSAGNNYTISFTGNKLTITKAPQTITWTQSLVTGCNGATAIALTATSSSGLQVAYTTGNNNIATVNGSTLTPVSAGSTLITAAQPGDNNHLAATPVTNTFNYQSASRIRQHWNEVLLFDNIENNYTQWQWYKNGNAVPGATLGYYSEASALNGTYYAVATDKNGNTIQTCPLTLTGTNTAKEGIKVFPNPGTSGGAVTVTTSYNQSALVGARLIISSSNGTIIQQITTVQPVTQITLPSNGSIYSVTLLLSNGQKVTVNVLVK